MNLHHTNGLDVWVVALLNYVSNEFVFYDVPSQFYQFWLKKIMIDGVTDKDNHIKVPN